MADNARGVHVSPGIYSREIDLNYAVKSLGITTLGVVGETQRGPAFQPMMIENWRDFQSMFGGTSTEKFAGSQYPKYELPYIAKSYLTESNQLQVCRVLGLSGYNAGPAWVITANNGMVVAVLRSRGYYEKYHKYTDLVGDCKCPQQTYDTLFYQVGEVKTDSRKCTEPKFYNEFALQIKPYVPLDASGNECFGYGYNASENTFDVTSLNHGQFKLVGVIGAQTVNEDKSFTLDSGATGYFEYAVTLNPNDKNYILKVLGTEPQNGDAPIYVESLYDVALGQLIEENEITEINGDLTFYQVYYKSDYDTLESVFDFISKQEESLTRKDIGRRFLATEEDVKNNVHCHPYDYKSNKPIFATRVDELPESKDVKVDSEDFIAIYNSDEKIVTFYHKQEKPKQEQESAAIEPVKEYEYVKYSTADANKKQSSYILMSNVEVGQIYTVTQYTDQEGKRHYYYKYYMVETLESLKPEDGEDDLISWTKYHSIVDKIKDTEDSDSEAGKLPTLVKNNADGHYYRIILNDDKDSNYPQDKYPYVVGRVTCDMNDYKDSYNFASTPWIVSNIKGDYNRIELNKLFRFHTISDGNSANNEIKISIQNIRPNEGVFDVIVRDINDSDEFIVPLEKFGRCSLVPGDHNYIAYKIGSFDGAYESKSKYITVEVNENTITKNSSPAGFLGYPLSQYGGLQIGEKQRKNVIAPIIKYNLNYDEDVKHRKQYFGLSSWVGTDVDMFTYKGKAAYSQEPEYLSQGFHLDSRLNLDGYPENEKPIITVDGAYGYVFDAVSTQNRTAIYDETPVIGTEAEMQGSIYEYVDLRKFTVYFYGGFDGWDPYRTYRSNTDDFKMTKYQGDYNEYSGEGFSFNKIENPEVLGLNQQGITSDWYAYLAAIRQFSNPESVDINVFATPGIDLFNNKLLAQEVIEMIEEERADSIYVATVPDKPFGASDYIDDMYTADDMVYELEDTEIDSNYTCTYYPWIKYEDVDNNQYIMLPPTKDVVRNMAYCDNAFHSWFVPAGLSRGDVNCVRAHYVTKLADEDVLYEGRINPVKTFASDGVKIWGQKNLQVRESLLNRIAVRRLLLRLRKLVAISCLGLIFDPNDATTKNKFLSTVTPILDNIKANRGISDYKIEVNDTVESRERRELPAKIYFKPINALEYITLDFIVTPESVSFSDI